MKHGVSVTIDEEMFRKFKGKTDFWRTVRFAPGVVIRLIGSDWRYLSNGLGLLVFKAAEEGGSIDLFQYSREFTEWLKVHRPEVFL